MCRFAIRDLLWLTVVAAVGTVWWLDHRQKIVLERDQLALQEKSHELQSIKATLRDGLGSDQAATTFLQALKNSRNVTGPDFVRIKFNGRPDGAPLPPAVDPNGGPMRYPRFAEPLTPTWPPR